MKKSHLLGLCLAASAFAVPTPVQAAFLTSISDNGGVSQGDLLKGNFGVIFRTGSQAITISALGYFDAANGPTGSLGDGLRFAHSIGIWDMAGNQLTPVGTQVPRGTESTLIDGFRYVSIPSVVLAANSTYIFGNSFSQLTDTALMERRDLAGGASFLAPPDAGSTPKIIARYSGEGNFAGPNFQYAEGAAPTFTNPAPGGLVLAGFGLTSLFGYSWRKRRQAV